MTSSRLMALFGACANGILLWLHSHVSNTSGVLCCRLDAGSDMNFYPNDIIAIRTPFLDEIDVHRPLLSQKLTDNRAKTHKDFKKK